MPEAQGSVGPATDRDNAPVVDPTANVIALAAANDRRQDDLRIAEGRYRDAQVRHVEAMAQLRAQHARELRLIETERINAIRTVDTQNVSRAAEVAAQQADALRGQVEAARVAVADTLSTALEPIQKDIAELRKTQYEQAGQKAASADPDTIALRALQLWQAQQAGAGIQKTENRSAGIDTRTFVVALLALIVAVIGAAALIGAHL